MNEMTLRQLYEAHRGKVSDKWSIYLSEYDRLFTPYRNLEMRLLEIGIQNGGSLEVWCEYFSRATQILGCDINPDCSKLTYSDERVAVVVGDANSDETESAIAERCASFDLIIDDGSHTSSDIIRAFARYFPRLVDGGMFVAEDLHCSYWSGFQGGLFDPASSISFFKRLADIVNHEHWGVPRSRGDVLTSFMRKYDFDISEDLLRRVHSVEFINSMCVIRKNPPYANVLGPRFIAGQQEVVVPGHLDLHQSPAPVVHEESNPWSARERLPEDEQVWAAEQLHRQSDELDELRVRTTQTDAEIVTLRSDLSTSEELGRELNARLTHLQADSDTTKAQLELTRQQLAAAQSQVAGLVRQAGEVFASTSWRLTSPVRWIGRQIKRTRGG